MSGSLCIFGEVLYDHFPDGKRVLGGAPFNVAWHLQAFGREPSFISRVGNDEEGESIRAAMRDWGMNTDLLQVDADHATGRVSVEFNDGEPAYDIVHPSAWDHIQSAERPQGCSVLYHGSLALRDEVSRQALLELRSRSARTVFVDVNLRPPWWRAQSVLDLIQGADWVKLNSDELAALSPQEQEAGAFLQHHQLQGLLLTHGSKGAEVITAAGENYSVVPRQNISMVDTVGAGDAFASVFILGLTLDWPLQQVLDRAQDFASSIVGRQGATVSDPEFYRSFISKWRLST